MISSHRKAWLKLLLTAIFLWTTITASAAGICEIPNSLHPGGIGGTGYLPEKGLGGTGAPQHQGIGGTGKPLAQNTSRGDGIGGTGQRAGLVIGTITGFGSICVNGIEIHYTDSTPLSSDGRPISTKKLAIGQVVAAKVNGTGKEVYAKQLQIQHAVTGPVTSLNLTRGQISILGQTVNIQSVRSDINLNTLKPGVPIAVSGLRNQQGHIIASRIDLVPVPDRVAVHGPITQIDKNYFMVQGTRIQTALPDEFHLGMLVDVIGKPTNAHTIQPEKIMRAVEQTLPADIGGLISVETYVHPEALERIIHFAGKQIEIPEDVVRQIKQRKGPQKVIVRGKLASDTDIHATDIMVIPQHLEFQDDHLQRHDEHQEPSSYDHADDNSTEHTMTESSDASERSSASHFGSGAIKHDESERPEQPSSKRLGTSEFEKPERPEFEMPEHSEFEKPERPEFEKPERPEFEKPERPEFEKPERPEFEKPERPEFEMPERH